MNGADRLVVGGAGFIGSALVRRLVRQGPVRVLDDLSTGSRQNLEEVEDVDLQVGSLLDDDAVEAAVQGVRVIYHLACLGVRHSIHSPVANHDVNAAGTLRLLEAARRAEVDRFVYTSTSEVYGTARTVPMGEDHPTWPHTVYGGSKLAGEAYVRAYHVTYGLPTVVLRPFNAFGPRSHHEGDSGEVIPRFLVRAMNGLPPIMFGDGSQTRDFTYVDDTAAAIGLAATVDGVIGQTINVGSGREVAIVDLAELVLRVTGHQDLGIQKAPARPGDVHRLICDVGRANELLGWTSETSLEEGLRRMLIWHEDRGTRWMAALEDAAERNWEPSPS